MLWVMILFTIVLILVLAPYLIGKSKKQLDEMNESLDIRIRQLKRDFQFQTKELKRRLDSGDLAESEWQTLTEELKTETALSLAGTENAARKGTVKQTPSLMIVLIAFAVLVSFISYEMVGFEDYQKNQTNLINQIKNDPQAIDNLRNKLRENPNQETINNYYLALRSRVDLTPDDVSAWQDLTYFNASYGREEEALKTIRVALRKHPQSLDLKVDKAQLLTTSSDTKEIIEGHKLLGEVLQQEPNHQGALLIRGDSAFRIGMYDLAISSWEQLKSFSQSNPQMTKALDDRIQMATNRRSGNVSPHEQTSPHTASANESAPVADTDTASQLANTDRPGISVAIQIAPQLMDRLDGNEDIFIFARAASGPPFPIAVVKTRVGDLYGPVELNDTQAMQEQFALSNYDEVIINARISFTGSPTAVSGDIQGTSDTVKRPFPSDPLVLVLDQVVE